ncbi:MAG: HIRAN domain-containing protein [Pseudomonadota bacterium]
MGDIIRKDGNKAEFRYLHDSEDFRRAQDEGFTGYPAFRTARVSHEENVLDAFVCRLPSRKRGDFHEYLAAHSLPENFQGSDFSLLAHTGAKLPGDGFEIIPDLTGIHAPYDLILEIAGTRHQDKIEVVLLKTGDSVQLVLEPSNVHDPLAIAVIHPLAKKLGYIPKPYCAALRHAIENFQVVTTIQKLNGSPDRPLIYLCLRVTEKSAPSYT